MKRFAQLVQHAARDARRIVIVMQIGDQQTELVAVQTRNGIDLVAFVARQRIAPCAPTSDSRCADCDQQLVARAVAERVVDALELVEIQREHAQLAVDARRDRTSVWFRRSRKYCRFGSPVVPS